VASREVENLVIASRDIEKIVDGDIAPGFV